MILSSQLGKVLGVPVDGDGIFENVADVLRPHGRLYFANVRRTYGAWDSPAIFGSSAEAHAAAQTAR